jgi:hypothetical protein
VTYPQIWLHLSVRGTKHGSSSLDPLLVRSVATPPSLHPGTSLILGGREWFVGPDPGDVAVTYDAMGAISRVTVYLADDTVARWTCAIGDRTLPEVMATHVQVLRDQGWTEKAP